MHQATTSKFYLKSHALYHLNNKSLKKIILESAQTSSYDLNE